MAETALQYLPLHVPEPLYPEVLSYLASLLAPEESARGEESEWTDERLKSLYWDLPAIEPLLLALAARPGDWLTTGELAQAIGPEADWRSVAALLGHMTRKRKSYGLASTPFRLRTDPKTGRYSYMMSAEMAERVRATHGEFTTLLANAPTLEELQARERTAMSDRLSSLDP